MLPINCFLDCTHAVHYTSTAEQEPKDVCVRPTMRRVRRANCSQLHSQSLWPMPGIFLGQLLSKVNSKINKLNESHSAGKQCNVCTVCVCVCVEVQTIADKCCAMVSEWSIKQGHEWVLQHQLRLTVGSWIWHVSFCCGRPLVAAGAVMLVFMRCLQKYMIADEG